MERMRFSPHTTDTSKLVLSNDGRLLVSGSRKEDRIKLWDVESAGSFSPGETQVSSDAIALSPDHTTLADSDSDKLYFWDPASGAITQSLDGSLTRIGFGYSPDGQYLISFSSNWKTLALRDGKTGRLLATFDFDYDSIDTMTYSPDSITLAVISSGTVSLIDLKEGWLHEQLSVDIREARFAAYTADGRELVVTEENGRTTMWNPADGTKIEETALTGTPFVLSLHGDRVAVGAGANQELQIWDVENDKMLWSESYPDINDIDIWYKYIFTPNQELLVFPDPDGLLTLWKAKTGRQLFTFEDASWDDIAFSEDGVLFG
jgi:hypothetical protein